MSDSTAPNQPATIGAFEEEPGVTSSTRIKSMICLVAAIAVVFVVIFKGSEGPLLQFAGIAFALLLVAAFFPQYLKQIIESKLPDAARREHTP
jgi:hypothetical protein